MKIQCNVCSADEASVFCSADEAALCATCDHRVHHANKLASKHHRFSLIHPSPKQIPLCDICQEKRAFLFCQQDRAILCRDCDVQIHKANEHTKNHSRFLLTGIKLSATPDLHKSSSIHDSSINGCDSSATKKPVSDSSSQIYYSSSINHHYYRNPFKNGDLGLSSSSISEYLIDTLPGWHVEDLLDSYITPFGFSKNENGALPLMDNYDFESNLDFLSTERNGIWIPQAPLKPANDEYGFTGNMEKTANIKIANKAWFDDGFTVPQISPPSSTGYKRSRTLW